MYGIHRSCRQRLGRFGTHGFTVSKWGIVPVL